MKSLPAWVRFSLAIIFFALLIGGFWFYRSQAARNRASVEQELESIGRLKAEQIAAWRRERLADAGVLMDNPYLRVPLARWFAGETPAATRAELEAYFESVRERYGYAAVILISPQGEILLRQGRGITLDPGCIAAVLDSAYRGNEPVLTDLHRAHDSHAPHISAVAPFQAISGDALTPIGAIALVSKAEDSLYPVIQSWPTPSESGETLLVERDGEEVLFLNELRHQKGTALELRFPLSQADLPATSAVLGQYGVVQGYDYRGVEVLSVVLPVPGSPWAMVAKIDVAEAFAAWRLRAAAILVLFIGAVLLAILVLLSFVRRQQRDHYQALYRSEMARRESEARHGITLRSIGDAVVVTDAQGRVDLLNPVAEDLTGWTSREAQGRPLAEVFRIINEHSRQVAESPVARVLAEGVVVGLANHTILIARDGTERPIADSGAPIRDPDGRIMGVVLVFRDMTAERDHERRLEESLARQAHLVRTLRAIRDVNQLITREPDRQRLIQGACACMTETLAYTSACIALADEQNHVLMIGGSGTGIWYEDLRCELESGNWPEAAERIHLEGELVDAVDVRGPSAARTQAETGAALRTQAGTERVVLGRRLEFDGRTYGVFAVTCPAAHAGDDEERSLFGELAADVAFALKRIEDEEERIALQKRHEAVLTTTSDAIVLSDREGKIAMFSPGAEKLLGYEAQEVLGQSLGVLCPPDLHGEQAKLKELARERGSLQGVETERLTKSGRRISVEMTINARTDEAGRPAGFVAVLRDVTARKATENALRESKRRLDTTGRLAKVGGWEHDLQTRKAHWTHALYEIIEIDPAEEPPGVDEHLDYYPPESRQRLERAYSHAVNTGEPFDLELEVNTRGGRRLWCRAYGQPVMEAGRCTRIQGTFQDITERKTAELQLETALDDARRSAVETRALLDGARSVLESRTFPEVAQRIFAASCAAVGATAGYVALLSEAGDENEVLFLEPGGLSCDVDPDLPMPVRGLRERAYREGRVVWENDFAHTDWAELLPAGHVELRNVLFAPLLVDEKPVGVIGLANKAGDFSAQDARLAGAFGNLAAIAFERSQAEETLRQSEEKYRLLADNTADCIWMLGLDSRLLYVNPAAERLFGFRPEEMIGMELHRYTTGESQRQIETIMAEALAQAQEPKPITFETELLHREGHAVPVEITGRVLTDGEGRPVALQGVTREISERKRAAAEQADLQAQLAQAQKMESVGRLAGGVAHDFNNMLQVIIGNTDLALGKPDLTDDLRDDLQEIRTAAASSAKLTRQLLAFARRQTVSPRVLDLNETVSGMLKMLQRLIGEDIELRWLPQADLWPIRIDPSQVDQILANLAVNARDAISGTGRIEIATENVTLDPAFAAQHPGSEPGEWVRLQVSDSGVGMDAETLAHVFDPFFTTKGLGQGTGLGLATIYGIVKQNDGYVDVTSEPQRGTTFMIYFPRSTGAGEEDEHQPAADTLRGAGEKLLLVEDEPSILNLCRAMLSGLGYDVLAAGTIRAAIDLAAGEDRLDLLITDVVMPQMNGWDLAARLREGHPGLLTLFMSGYPTEVIARRGRLAEGVSFIQKPFTADELAAKVRARLDDPERGNP